MSGKVFAYNAAGKPVELQEHQQEAALSDPSYTPVSQQQAQQAVRADESADRVDQKYGTVGKALAGFAHGTTLGGSTALASKLGMIDQPDAEALQETGAFQAGDIAGMLAPAFFSGGESVAARGAIAGAETAERGILARALGWTPAGMLNAAGGATERLAGAFLPEATGLLGKVVRPTLQMAARGASEGAIVNMAHTASDSVIQNKPLTAQALAATGVDGALFGGLAGGILGGAGALAGAGVDAVGGGVVGKLGGKGDTAAAIALRRLGATGDDLATMSASEGGLVGALKGHYANLGGETLASKTSVIAKTVRESEQKFAQTAEDVIKTADREIPSLTPNVERMEARIQSDLAKKFGGTTRENDVARVMKGLSKDLEPLAGVEPKATFDKTAPIEPVMPTNVPGAVPMSPLAMQDYRAAFAKYKDDLSQFKAAKALHDELPDIIRSGKGTSWEGWAKSRSHIAELADKSRGTTNEVVYRTALNAMDDEFTTAMSDGFKSVGKPELAEKYAGAKAGEAQAKATGKLVNNRLAGELGASAPPVGPREVGTFAGMAAIGHPISGAAFVSAKGIGKILEQHVEPAIAESAYRMAIGAQASGATVTVGQRINSALKSFIGNGTKAASGYRSMASPYVKYDYKSFSKVSQLADDLTDAAHQAKVQEMAKALTEAGHPELATEMLATNQRATEYINHNRVKDNKARAAGSLTKPAKETGMSTQGWRFMRIIRVAREPLSVLDDVHNGSLSRDAVNAFKYIYPDLHQEIVSQMASELMTMKQSGKFLPSDKLNTLATLACAPLDTKQDKPFVNAIQQGFASAKQAAGNQPGQGASAGGQPVQTAYSTPLQHALT